MFSKIFNRINKIFLAASSVIIFAWLIKPVRDVLTNYRVIIDTESIMGILSLAIVLVLLSLDHNKKSINELTNSIKSRFDGLDIIENGVKNVYPLLLKDLEKRKSWRSNEFNVIGLTMYSAWPQIHAWITNQSVKKWNIKIYILDPEFIQENSDFIDIEWAEVAQTNYNVIKQFIDKNELDLKKRELKIEISKYKQIPFVHGFKIDDETIFISYCEWNKNNLIAMPTNFYEQLNLNNKDKRTKNYESLFNNHLSSIS